MKDALYEIFEKHLYAAPDSQEQEDQFIEKVVDEYLLTLTSQGHHIPMNYKQMLRDDLKEEVRQMLKAKTYGYFNLNAFREANDNDTSKKPPRSS